NTSNSRRFMTGFRVSNCKGWSQVRVIGLTTSQTLANPLSSRPAYLNQNALDITLTRLSSPLRKSGVTTRPKCPADSRDGKQRAYGAVHRLAASSQRPSPIPSTHALRNREMVKSRKMREPSRDGDRTGREKDSEIGDRSVELVFVDFERSDLRFQCRDGKAEL